MSDITDLKAEVLLLYKENAELREQTELLITLLRNDCDIEASWDGLRKFWIIGLTESGCLMRDRACKAEAENAKLRELVRELWNCALQYHRFDVYRHEIGVDGCGIGCTANGESCCACKLEQRMRELGVEV